MVRRLRTSAVKHFIGEIWSQSSRYSHRLLRVPEVKTDTWPGVQCNIRTNRPRVDLSAALSFFHSNRHLLEYGVVPRRRLWQSTPVPAQEAWESRVWSLGQEDPQEKGKVTHSSILAWKIPWTQEPGRLQSIGLQRVRHDWAAELNWTDSCFPSSFSF